MYVNWFCRSTFDNSWYSGINVANSHIMSVTNGFSVFTSLKVASPDATERSKTFPVILSNASAFVNVATFTNADALDRITGNVFERSVASGEATLREVKTENPLVTDIMWEFATFMPEYHELSNVDLQNQFTYMIMSQQAC